MKQRIQTILFTAVATTVAWALLIVGFFWLAPRFASEEQRATAAYVEQNGFLGVMETVNPHTQHMVVLVEEVASSAAGTSRPVLLRRELAPGQRVRVGLRETKGQND